jgi:hypothetical protein
MEVTRGDPAGGADPRGVTGPDTTLSLSREKREESPRPLVRVYGQLRPVTRPATLPSELRARLQPEHPATHN